jgi:transposase
VLPRAQEFYEIPEETARIARAAFPKGSPYMRLRDELGPIYSSQQFAHLFPNLGQPAEDPARLSLATIMQFAEGLSDRQAADAVRGRIDWKYALSLEMTDPGFDASVLSEFRGRLIAGSAEMLLFESMLNHLRERQLLKPRGRQRTDSTHVLAAIQVLNRLECVGETLRHALNTLAVAVPDWLLAQVPAVWFDRYGRRFEEYRLPSGRPERYALAEEIGADGRHLLTAIADPSAPSWLREVPAVQILRRVWIQQFYAAEPDQPIRWRKAEDLPPAPLLISSPYDPDARYSKKRKTEWTGYKVHLTETCDDDLPHLITDVLTTPATTTDFDALPTVQDNLDQRGLCPDEHLVDAGYVTADHLVTSQQEHGIDLVGPAPKDSSWQAKAADGFPASQFVIDWEAQVAICPQGNRSACWMSRQDRHGHPIAHIKFKKADCLACPRRSSCTRSETQPRLIQIRAQAQYEALQAARKRQATEIFKDQYAARAGIEGTISQGTRTGDLRRSRYIGLPKTRLHHLLLATGINLLRVCAWLADVPRSQTRRSAFAVLGASCA